MEKKVKRRIAFTLAETLITLGIIGVVAAITIPTIMQNVQDQAFRSMFKKDYALLQQAVYKINYDNGGMFNPDTTFYSPISFDDRLKNISISNGSQLGNLLFDQYLPIVQHCSSMSIGGSVPPDLATKWFVPSKFDDTGNECWVGGSGYNWMMGLNGKLVNGFLTDVGGSKGMILNNGSAIHLSSYGCTITTTGTCWNNVIIDVNHMKSPNVIGKDRFVLSWVKDNNNYARLIPYPADPNTTCNGNSTDAANTGLGCAAKALLY